MRRETGFRTVSLRKNRVAKQASIEKVAGIEHARK